MIHWGKCFLFLLKRQRKHADVFYFFLQKLYFFVQKIEDFS